MPTKHLAILAIVCGLLGFGLATVAAAPLTSADGTVVLLSAAVDAPQADAGAAAVAPQAAPTEVANGDLLDQLKEVHAKYEALKANKDKSAKLLLWAALLAGVLKVALSIVNLAAGKKPAKWLAWIALGLSLPIALLSHYALGNSVFDSLVFAGAGPGAVIVHELLKVFAKKQEA